MKALIKIQIILFIASVLFSCESIITDDASEFCNDVSNLNFIDLDNKIEKYLDDVKYYHIELDTYYEVEIYKLEKWMESKNCVLDVSVPKSIVEVGPGLKHITIKFVNTDSTFIKYLDVILDSDLNVQFH